MSVKSSSPDPAPDRGARTRERILEAALRQFTRHGFRKASLEPIADEVGLVKGALYYYFPGGKQGLFDAVAEEVESRLLTAMRAAAVSSPAPHALEAAFKAKLCVLDELRERLGVAPEIVAEVLALVRHRGHAYLDAERALIAGVLARGEKEGTLRHLPARTEAARAIQSLLQTPLTEALLQAEPARWPPAVFELLGHALAGEPPRGRAR